MSTQVALVFGGNSSERDIALQSAQYVGDNMPFPFVEYDIPNELDSLWKDRKKISVAVPVFHGKGGEDGQIQGFLDTAGIPYIFSSLSGHAVAMDKRLSKLIAQAVGVRTAPWTIVKQGQEYKNSVPAVIKPVDEGSSVGVSIVKTQKDLKQAFKKASKEGLGVIVEQYIKGREYTVCVVERGRKPIALPVIYIKPKGEFFDYRAKYTKGEAQEQCPARISVSLEKQLQSAAITMHKSLGLRHISRSDFIVDLNNNVYFLETNTIPGLTENSLVPKALKAAKISLSSLLKDWINDAKSFH